MVLKKIIIHLIHAPPKSTKKIDTKQQKLEIVPHLRNYPLFQFDGHQ